MEINRNPLHINLGYSLANLNDIKEAVGKYRPRMYIDNYRITFVHVNDYKYAVFYNATGIPRATADCPLRMNPSLIDSFVFKFNLNDKPELVSDVKESLGVISALSIETAFQPARYLRKSKA